MAKTLAFLMPPSDGIRKGCGRHYNLLKTFTMTTAENVKKNRGGRPPKTVKCDRQITVMCNPAERNIIACKAKQAGVTLSEYLRTVGVNGKIDSSKSELAKEVLAQKATLNHTAENINQYTRKLNSTGILSVEERMHYRNLSAVIKETALLIKSRLL
jgi:hypothetical protein